MSGKAGLDGWVRRVIGVLLGCCLACLAGAAHASSERPEAGPGAATPAAKLQALTRLLADPDIQALLASREGGRTESPAPSAPPKTMAISLADRLGGLRQHLIDLAAATRTLPGEAAMARDMVGGALDQRGWATAGAFFAGFIVLGFGVEWLFRILAAPIRRWLIALTLDTVNQRVRAVFTRFGFSFGLIVSFGLGSVGAFLLFDWPIVLKEILLGYLIAFLLVRLFAVLGRVLLAPGAERFRVVPLSTEAAAFLFRHWILLAAILGFGWQTISLFGRFGLSPQASEICGDAIGLLVLLVALDIVWRTPRLRLSEGDAADASQFAARHHASLGLGLSVVLAVLWLLWVIGAKQVFWLAAFALALPFTIMVARRSVNHTLRPAGLKVSVDEVQTLDVIVFERGVRSVILVGAALLLARILDVDIVSLTMVDSPATRIVRGLVSILTIGLAADFLWHVTKALIDRRLAASLMGSHDTTDAGHVARLQTLLPIVSNILFVVLVVVTGMMMLASVGVEIGPLIASAGVVGVAIGFGAQTLVKDIISGIFYLFDDAFRIGEYIQSGTFKGTVESFSLRSVKLRHQRGALYTVPFGILGAVQNQSRDWVVDKIVLNVPYGTDLDRVRKLIKRIGETLAEDEELGPLILNPLKMQGVVQFGDFAIQIQTKMMTKPGDVQFLARRRALLMINHAFAENGIGFAMPMVHVAGGGDQTAAAAQKGFELVQAAKPM